MSEGFRCERILDFEFKKTSRLCEMDKYISDKISTPENIEKLAKLLNKK
jgi:hypothetical protein